MTAMRMAENAAREIVLAHTSGACDLVEQNDVKIIARACRAWAVERLQEEAHLLLRRDRMGDRNAALPAQRNDSRSWRRP